MSQDEVLSFLFKHPASKQYYAPYTGECKKKKNPAYQYKPTLWGLL